MADDKADVRSVEIIDWFRNHLVAFGTAARQALDEGYADLLRTQSWIEYERIPELKMRIRKREEGLVRAKSELYRIQLAKTSVGDTEAKIGIRKAQQALADARAKLEACRKWHRKLHQAQTTYRSALAGLRHSIEIEVPHAVALLHGMAESLDAYVGLSPEDADRLLADVSSDDQARNLGGGTPSMRRDPSPMDQTASEEDDMDSSEIHTDQQDEGGD